MNKNSTGFNQEYSKTKSGLTRREFIKSSLVLTAGITLVGCNEELLSPASGDSQKEKIVIVGAGLSGLVSAYELSKAGYDVVVLEANDRIGGRVFTIRDPFSNGQFAEAGAARIPPSHNHTLHYINEFGLELDHFYPRTGDYINYRSGRKLIISNNNFLSDRPWPGSVPHSEYSKIRGGSDRLPIAFAKQLPGKIYLSSPVVSIDQRSSSIKVRIRNGKFFTADRVIVTVPLTVLNKIEFIPELSTQKLEVANGGYNYASSTRVYLQTKTRFWENNNLNGWGKTDWPEEMWQPTFDQNGDSGIIMNYASYNRADELDLLISNERVESLVNRWQAIFPGLENHVDHGTSFSWVNEEWSKGAYAHPTFNQSEKYDRYIGEPEGRVYFAGEHISNYHGWMQGALASGLKVVNEIINAEVSLLF